MQAIPIEKAGVAYSFILVVVSLIIALVVLRKLWQLPWWGLPLGLIASLALFAVFIQYWLPAENTVFVIFPGWGFNPPISVGTKTLAEIVAYTTTLLIWLIIPLAMIVQLIRWLYRRIRPARPQEVVEPIQAPRSPAISHLPEPVAPEPQIAAPIEAPKSPPGPQAKTPELAPDEMRDRLRKAMFGLKEQPGIAPITADPAPAELPEAPQHVEPVKTEDPPPKPRAKTPELAPDEMRDQLRKAMFSLKEQPEQREEETNTARAVPRIRGKVTSSNTYEF